MRVEARGNRYLFEVSKNRTIDGKARSNVARYANHSCNPNAEPVIWRGRVFIATLRNIKPGEEIVYDYGIDYLRNVIGTSNCRCSRCRRRRARKQREARARKKRMRGAAQETVAVSIDERRSDHAHGPTGAPITFRSASR